MPNNTDGGPAFPNNFGVPGEKTVGLSLRDWFAGQALAPLVTEFMQIDSAWEGYDDVAESAYNIADAMLAAREK